MIPLWGKRIGSTLFTTTFRFLSRMRLRSSNWYLLLMPMRGMTLMSSIPFMRRSTSSLKARNISPYMRNFFSKWKRKNLLTFLSHTKLLNSASLGGDLTLTKRKWKELCSNWLLTKKYTEGSTILMLPTNILRFCHPGTSSYRFRLRTWENWEDGT